jgi:hypothetical protein
VRDIFNEKKPELKWDHAKFGKMSQAALGLAKWCSAIFKYAETLKNVRPKEQKVKEMQEKFK